MRPQLMLSYETDCNGLNPKLKLYSEPDELKTKRMYIHRLVRLILHCAGRFVKAAYKIKIS